MAEESAKEAPAEQSAPRDPFMLILVVLLVVVYVVGQWLMFTMLAEKLDALEQRIVDTTSRTDTKVDAVNETILKATKVLKSAAPAAAPAPAEEKPAAAEAKPAEDEEKAEEKPAEKKAEEKPAEKKAE